MLNARWRMLMAVVFVLSTGTFARGNDIEDFFRALRGGSNQRPATVPVRQAGFPGNSGHLHHHAHGPLSGSHPVLGSRDIHKQYQLADEYYERTGRYGSPANRYNPDRRDRDYQRSLSDVSGARISFRVAGNSTAYRGLPDSYETYPGGNEYWPDGRSQPLIVPPAPSAPVYPGGLPIPHQLGEIVTCPVRLETCVRIEDAHKIAPNAVPVVVAVRDPHLPPHHTGCATGIVYVEVCVPPCPMRSLKISPCRTRIRMDFGDYEVDIRSTRDQIVVDYDD